TADVGVGGLTLSGGIGWLVRRDGLTLDHLRAVELVTAEGSVVTADADHHAELFWAVRGGGGAYGVVTAFEFEARPLEAVEFAVLTFPAAEAPQVVPAWARLLGEAPDGVSSTVVLADPQAGGADAPIVVSLAVTDESARTVIDDVRALGTVLGGDVRRCACRYILHDGAELPAVLRAAVRAAFVGEGNRDAAAAAAARMAAEEQPAAIVLHALGGAFGRVDPTATAFAHRGAALMITTFAVAPAAAIGAGRARLADRWAPLEPLVDGAYAISLDGASARAVADAYPEAVRARLAAIKAQYDPAGLFARTLVPVAS